MSDLVPSDFRVTVSLDDGSLIGLGAVGILLIFAFKLARG